MKRQIPDIEEPESSGEEETSETETIEEAYTFVFKGLDIRKATYAECKMLFLTPIRWRMVVCRRCLKFFTELSADAGIPVISSNSNIVNS